MPRVPSNCLRRFAVIVSPNERPASVCRRVPRRRRTCQVWERAQKPCTPAHCPEHGPPMGILPRQFHRWPTALHLFFAHSSDRMWDSHVERVTYRKGLAVVEPAWPGALCLLPAVRVANADFRIVQALQRPVRLKRGALAVQSSQNNNERQSSGSCTSSTLGIVASSISPPLRCPPLLMIHNIYPPV